MTQRRDLLLRTAPLAITSLLIGGPTAIAAADPAALLRRYIELKNAHDASHCSELFIEDYVEHSGRNPSGLAALIANWQGQFAGIPDLQLTLEDQVIAADRVVARITYAGSHTRPFFQGLAPTGKRFSFGTIDIWRVAEGRFAEHWDQVDFAGLARQLQS